MERQKRTQKSYSPRRHNNSPNNVIPTSHVLERRHAPCEPLHQSLQKPKQPRRKVIVRAQMGTQTKPFKATNFWMQGLQLYRKGRTIAPAGKLHPTAIPCIYIGVGEHEQGWLMFNPKVNKSFYTRNASFDESTIGYTGLSLSLSTSSPITYSTEWNRRDVTGDNILDSRNLKTFTSMKKINTPIDFPYEDEATHDVIFQHNASIPIAVDA
jgi:hypothetical protein